MKNIVTKAKFLFLFLSVFVAVAIITNIITPPGTPPEKHRVSLRVVEPRLPNKNGRGIKGAEVTYLSEGKEITEKTAKNGSVSFIGEFPVTVRVAKSGYIARTVTLLQNNQEIVLPNQWPKAAQMAAKKLGFYEMVSSGHLVLRWGYPGKDKDDVYAYPNIIIRRGKEGIMLFSLIRQTMRVWQGYNSSNPPFGDDWERSEDGLAWATALRKDLEQVGEIHLPGGGTLPKSPSENQTIVFALWFLSSCMEPEMNFHWLCEVAPNRCKYFDDLFSYPPNLLGIRMW